jgi:DNA repair protein RadC
MALTPLYRATLVRDGSCRVEERPRATNPAALVPVLRAAWEDDGVEKFGVILLDVRHRVTGVVMISSGCLTSSLVHPREVFVPAILHKAAAIVIAHNHPSGDPEPSAEDISMTRRVAAGGTLLGIEVLDSMIIGDGSGRWVSLKERGIL